MTTTTTPTTTPTTTLSTRQLTLLSAAVRVLATTGLRGLTHRAVDAEAGLPQGSCSAYMRTRMALLTSLTEFVTEHFSHDIKELTRRIEAHADLSDDYPVQQTIAMLGSWLLEPNLLVARVELTLEGSRQPEIARITRSQRRDLEQLVEHAMITGGHVHSRARASTLIAAIDGVLIHSLHESPADRAAYMTDRLELLMKALVGEAARPAPD